MKTCARCGVEKALGDYYRRAASVDGRQRICKPCTAERMREYRPKNRERFHEYDRRWREANVGKHRANNRAYYASNRERLQKYGRDWRAANPDHVREYDKTRDYKARSTYAAARRSREAGLPTEKIDRFALYERDGGKCHICNRVVSRTKFHLDHLVPVAHGGGYTADNLRVTHPSCNARRGAGRIPAQLLLVG